jgi:hypothetical protein
MICEECEQEVDSLCTKGRFTGVCHNCEVELRREDTYFQKDHAYVFGDGD